jgi:hypothetical protein
MVESKKNKKLIFPKKSNISLNRSGETLHKRPVEALRRLPIYDLLDLPLSDIQPKSYFR